MSCFDCEPVTETPAVSDTRGIIDAAARIVGVPAHQVAVSFRYNAPDDDDAPDLLVLRITVISNFMYGRGRNRQRARIFGTGVGLDCVRTALDDLVKDVCDRLIEQAAAQEKKARR